MFNQQEKLHSNKSRLTRDGSSKPAIEGLVRNLCKSLLKEQHPVRLEETTRSALRFLTNFNEFHHSNRDESALVEDMKQKLHESGKIEHLYNVGLLHTRLQQNQSLKNRKSIIHFLLSMSNHCDEKAVGPSLSFRAGLLTSTPAPSIIGANDSRALSSLKSSAKYDSSNLSSVPFGSTHKDSLMSSQNFTSLQTPPVHSSITPGPLGTMTSQQIVNSLVPSGLPKEVPNSYRDKMLNDSKQVDDTDLIRQILFVFQSIESKDIKLDHRENAFCIGSKVSVDRRGKQLLHRLCELGWLHLRISKFIKARRDDRKYGLVGQAFCAALEQEISEYYRLVSVLQAQLQSSQEDSTNSNKLTLHKLLVWASEPLERLKWIASLVDNCKGNRGECYRGGELLSAIHSFIQTGDEEARAITRRIMKIVSQPIVKVIDKWIYNGELQDPYQEFFVSADPAIGVEQLWYERYKMRTNMIPSFLPLEQANKILLVGKSINFLRLVCHDRSPILNNEPPSSHYRDLPSEGNVFDDQLNFAHDLMPRIDRAYKATSTHLLRVLNDRYKLNMHLHALRKFFLLGQGDFIRHLLDNLQDELKKPAEKIFRYNLQGHVEAAIRASNAQFEDKDVLSRLDFRILQRNKGDSGWNVFSLDYHADPPINTLITPQVTNEYLKIFMFLWRAKRVRHHLTEVWMKSMEYTRKLSPCIPELRGVLHKCHSLTAEMWNFVHQFHYYIAFEVLECSWADLQKTLSEAKDFDCVIRAHHSFLETLMRRCLLDKPSSNLLKGLRGIFGEILKFQVIHDEMFVDSLRELKFRRNYEQNRDEKEAKGVWGEDDEEEEEEIQRQRNFRKVIVSAMKNQLMICSTAYQDLVIAFLHELTQATDTNLRNLSWRLDFNETYRNKSKKK